MIVEIDDLHSCPFNNGEWGCCQITNETCCGFFDKPDDCPLIKGDVVVRIKEQK